MKKTVAVMFCSLALAAGLSPGNAKASPDHFASHAVNESASQHKFEANLTDAGPLPSCISITYEGNAGYISIQTTPEGRVVWGVYMHNPARHLGRKHSAGVGDRHAR
jgi:hypothetical protein